MAGILITGGSGRLGTALRNLTECIAPSHYAMDITDVDLCRAVVELNDPDVIIHCAGFVDAAKAEQCRGRCWQLNVDGTRNMIRAANGRRFVHISTDYVFDGRKGCYSESDVPNPVNFYGLTKLAGEMVVGEHGNTLILRAPFRADPPWRFDRAFTDQFTSCDFVSLRAPEILEAALSDWTGLLHIGGPRRSIYDLARQVSLVGQMSREEAEVNLPRDTSLNCSKWHSLKKAYRLSSQAAATSIPA